MYVCARDVNVVSAFKQRMHLWGPVPPRASRYSAVHTNTTRMRIDTHTHAHTMLRTHITVLGFAMAGTRAPDDVRRVVAHSLW